MDYPHYTTISSRTTPTYPSYASTSGAVYNDHHRDQRFLDSYGRSVTNPLPAMFRTATITSSSPPAPMATTRAQQFNYRPPTITNTYDTPRNYTGAISSGYISDTNDLRRSSISVRPTNGSISTARRLTNTNTSSSNQYLTPPTTYTSKLAAGGHGNDQSYYSDSEYVTAGPRYYKISRQINAPRRPSNVVLPIRSVTSKAYDPYIAPETPKLQQQQPFDFYRYQQEQQQQQREQREREQREREQREREQREREQRERERHEQLQRLFYQQQQQQQHQAAARYKPPQLTLPTQDHGHAPDIPIDHELGAELLKSPLHNKKRYADSSFFQTPYNTYPTIEEQKKMARKIALILEGGDPTQRGATKFEKQRQRAEKFTIETDSPTPTGISNYRPLRPMQNSSGSHDYHTIPPAPYYDTPDVPDCIKHSLDEAQYINPLRYVGAPEEFKQMHMQEHVTHTIVPPQAAMSLVADLNQSRGKGAALFQKRKARSEKWVIDEHNVKKQNHHQPTSSYIGVSAKPWGQRAPSSWSGDESGANLSPARPMFSGSTYASIPEQPFSPVPPVQPGMKFGDFNAKPKGFGAWNSENIAPQSPRGSIDVRKPLNLNIEPSIREGIAESHTRRGSQPWSPPSNPSALFSPNQQQQQSNGYFNYPSENIQAKWKTQDYSPWNQSSSLQDQRQRNTSQNQSEGQQQQYTYNDAMQKAFSLNQRGGNSAGSNPYASSQQSQQQHHFTDL
jgi:hypothetical protein